MERSIAVAPRSSYMVCLKVRPYSSPEFLFLGSEHDSQMIEAQQRNIPQAALSKAQLGIVLRTQREPGNWI